MMKLFFSIFLLALSSAYTNDLFLAIQSNDVEIVEEQLKRHANVNEVSPYQMTALCLAAEFGHDKMIQLLLAAGADPNLEPIQGETALMLAARCGSLKSVEHLLKEGAKIDTENEADQTALMYAAHEGHTEVVEFLIKKGAKIEQESSRGLTAFLYAIRGGHIAVVETFIEHGVNINKPVKTKGNKKFGVKSGTTPLMMAIQNAHYELALKLLDAGAKPNELSSGLGVLHAIARVRKSDRGEGVLGMPSPPGSGKVSSLDFVEKFVKDYGGKTDLRLREHIRGDSKLARKGTTALILAAQKTDLEYMKLLSKLGADVNAENDDGTSALLAASGLGCNNPTEEAAIESEAIKCIEWLLSLDVEINQMNKRKNTVMHGASTKNFPKLVQYLHEKGADIELWNHKNSQGKTPLLVAQGFRPGGNFKPDLPTIEAFSKVMMAEGIVPPPSPKKDTKEKAY